MVRTLAGCELLDVSKRGWVSVAPFALGLAERRDAALRREDAIRLTPRLKSPRGAPGTSPSLVRHEATLRTTPPARYGRTPKYKIGFANAALDSPWRTALVHSVEFGVAKNRDVMSTLAVRHAAHSAARQVADIKHLLADGADGLIVSAVEGQALAPILADAARRGIPTVLVDRGLPDAVPHVSFVTCDDDVIGATTALWLAEYLGGKGGIVLLSGLAEAEPAQRRLESARTVFGRFPGLDILAAEWTGWQRSAGDRIMQGCLAAFPDRIAGVWCDSGLQAAGSLRAFLRRTRRLGRVPPHTGGDLNLVYKLAVRHGIPLAAVDYPPAMGLRSVEILLDVLRGRTVPRRVDVATETVVTRHDATASVKPDLWADEHVRWDLPDDLILASGLGASYDPRSFRVRYHGTRYNRSAALQPAPVGP